MEGNAANKGRPKLTPNPNMAIVKTKPLSNEPAKTELIVVPYMKDTIKQVHKHAQQYHLYQQPYQLY